MGYMRHHAIVVTGCDDLPSRPGLMSEAHKKATGLFNGAMVSMLSIPTTNSYQSFAVFPDGSKEGWFESEDGNKARNTFIKFLKSLQYYDRSSPLDWVEVQFGDSDKETVVTHHSDEEIVK